MTPEERIKTLTRKEEDPAARSFLDYARKLVKVRTDEPRDKINELLKSDAKTKNPLLWLNAMLATYDRGKGDVYDKVNVAREMRSTLARARTELSGYPDTHKSLFIALEQDLRTRGLDNLVFVDGQAAMRADSDNETGQSKTA